MKDEILKVIREEYFEYFRKGRNTASYNHNVPSVMENNDVKKYLANLDEISVFISQDMDKMYLICKKNMLNNDETNGIYVFDGTYCERGANNFFDESLDVRVYSGCDKIDYYKYINLENENDVAKIPAAGRENFEKSHKIIFPKEEMASGRFYYQVQELFFKTCVLQSQQEAVHKVMTL